MEITFEDVKLFLEEHKSDKAVEGLIQSLSDARVTQGVKSFEDTFRKDKLPAIVEAELKKRNEESGDKTAGELIKKAEELGALEKKLQARADLIEKAAEEKIPLALMRHLLGAEAPAGELIEAVKNYALQVKQEILKANKTTFLPGGDAEKRKFSVADIARMSEKEINEHWNDPGFQEALAAQKGQAQ